MSNQRPFARPQLPTFALASAVLLARAVACGAPSTAPSGDSNAASGGANSGQHGGQTDAGRATHDAGNAGAGHSGATSSEPTDGPRLCPPPAPSRCLVTLYGESNFQGAEVCLEEEGVFDAGTLKELGLPPSSVGAVRVAPGYYARFGSRTDASYVVLRGEDSDLNVPDHAEFISVTVQRRRTCAGRPRVFMALHGANSLASNAPDSQWPYVRSQLDGIWWNAAGVTPEETATLLRKIGTRRMIAVQVLGKDEKLRTLESFGHFEDRFPDLPLIREAMTLYKNSEDNWNSNDVAVARGTYADASGVPEAQRFQNIYGGFTVQQFVAPEGAPLPVDLTAGKLIVDQIDGGFIECATDICARNPAFKRGFRTLIDRLHATGRTFIWFNGTKDPAHTPPLAWFKGTQNAYFNLEADEKIGPNDIIMVINYGGLYPAVPEVTAERPMGATTTTGMLYWLLHQ